MKLITWNVNGLRACINKGFLDFFSAQQPEFFCLQETKMQQGQAEIDLAGYEEYWNSAEKKGYSGTAVFTKKKPLTIAFDTGKEEHSHEGRVITLEYPEFYLINCYTPNAQRELARLEYRMRWEEDFLEYLRSLDARKPLILCGDLNVAHREIDLKNPKSNINNAGFTPQERDRMSTLLDSGFVDAYRWLYPDKADAYTWWSYMFNARANNAGWRIDYFIVSERLKNEIRECTIFSEVMGSDHCPVGLEIF